MILKPGLFRRPNLSRPLARGLVGYWLMNEGSGNLVNDLSGNSRQGLIEGTAAWVPGKDGSAVKFNGIGVDDSINCGHQVNLFGGGSEMTFVAWVRPSITVLDESKYIVRHGNSIGNRVFLMYWHNTLNRLYGGVYNSSQTGYIAYAAAPFGGNTTEYKQVVLRLSNGQVAVFVDGIIGSSTAAFSGVIDDGGTTAYDYLRIGSDAGNGVGDNAWEGDISRVLIYNRALSASEIQQLYHESFGMFEREPIELWTGAMGGEEEPSVYDSIFMGCNF